MTRLGVLGKGRAASALVPRWLAAGHELAFWRSRADGPNTATPPCDVLVLAVTDAALPEVARELATRPSARDELWLHLSGATPASALRVDPATPRAVAGLHPLVALAPGADPTGAVAGIEAADAASAAVCERLARDAGLVPVALRDGSASTRALYHAAAVSVAGHATALFAQAMGLMGAAGFSAGDARAALQPLLLSAARNLAQAAPEAAITGPIARGDAVTVARHLATIDEAVTRGELPAEVSATYRLLATTALGLSAPRLAPELAAAVAAALTAGGARG